MLVLNEKSQTQKAASFMIPLTLHSGKVKTVKEKISGCQRLGKVEGLRVDFQGA